MRLDVDRVMEFTGLSEEELANVLFPGNKTAVLSLRSYRSGDRELKFNEVERLERVMHTPVEMFAMDEGDIPAWKSAYSKAGLAFRKGHFRALYNPNTGLCSLWDDRDEHDRIDEFFVPPMTSIGQFVNLLNQSVEDIS